MSARPLGFRYLLTALTQDTPSLRRDLEARLEALEHATCLQLVRFRRHTVRSAAGHMADVVADEVFGGRGDPSVGSSGRPGEPGCVIVALSPDGELGRVEVHPVGADFESVIVPKMASACARLGAALEVWVEHRPIVRKEVVLPAAGGYRDRPRIDRDALVRSQWIVSSDDTTIRHETAQPSRVWAAVILGAVGLLFFPITVLALLFRESREVLTGMMQDFLHGWRRSWEWSVRGGRARVRCEQTGRPDTTHELDLRETVVMTWPTYWSGDGTASQLVAITPQGVERWSCPSPDLVEAFLDAHR